jgi:nucleoside-diphosphate-sugar epimerase
VKTAIVTGANGFIGEAVCKALLLQGVTVYAVVKNSGSLARLADNSSLHVLESCLGNYNEDIALFPKNADVFYHLAWEGTSGPILGDYSQQLKNITYTCDALVFAAKIACKKFIMAGTINELELFQLMHAEENPPRPACIYGIAKLSSDYLCKTLALQHGIGFNCAIIGSCFGPKDMSKRIHNVFIHGILIGKPPKLVKADNLHDWVYIDDVADMFVRIGNKSVNLKNRSGSIALLINLLCQQMFGNTWCH